VETGKQLSVGGLVGPRDEDIVNATGPEVTVKVSPGAPLESMGSVLQQSEEQLKKEILAKVARLTKAAFYRVDINAYSSHAERERAIRKELMKIISEDQKSENLSSLDVVEGKFVAKKTFGKIELTATLSISDVVSHVIALYERIPDWDKKQDWPPERSYVLLSLQFP
jgi:hypothetical protein